MPVAVFAAVLGLGACRIEPVQRAARVDPRELAREEISAALDDYRDALLRGDAAAIAATFTDDGQLYMPDTPDIVGSDAIRTALGEIFTSYTATDLLLEREQIDIADDVAFEIGRYEESLRAAADSATLELRGRYAIRWRRGPDERWRIERMLTNYYPPADTAATR